MPDKKKQRNTGKQQQGSRQTNMAEGEPETVDESLRIHEQKKKGAKPKVKKAGGR